MVASAWLLGGCATVQRVNPPPGPHSWSGRLALVVQSDPVQSFAGSFELSGTAENGELALFTPLGNQVALLQWSPVAVTLNDGRSQRQYSSLADLTEHITGAALPVPALFQWLQGQDSLAAGWSVDLSEFGSGKLRAQRHEPLPRAILRMTLDR